MALAPGQKAQLLNVLDGLKAEKALLEPLYSIEMSLARSPRKGTKCGAIVVFRKNLVDLAATGEKDPRRALRVQNEMSEKTDVMYRDPEYFSEKDGRWIDWAAKRVAEMFTEFGGSARVTVKCKQLNIEQRISQDSMSTSLSDFHSVVSVVRDIDRLLTLNYKWDPWTKTIRRGRINANEAKR